MQRCHSRKSLSLLLLEKMFGSQNPSNNYGDFLPDSPFDQFAIKVCEKEGQKIPVGHLPRLFSRATKYLIDRGENITDITLTSNHY